MAMEDGALLILMVIIAALGGVIYSMRVLILLERRIARIDTHIELMARTILKDEEEIEEMLKKNNPKKKK